MSRRYDPSDFIVPPQVGDKGHSERIQCRIQSGHYRALGTVARSGVFPYEERNDVIRWCIKFGLERLNQLEPQLIRSVMGQANAAIAIAVEDQHRRKFLELFQPLHEQVSYYLGIGQPEFAGGLIKKIRTAVEGMPDQPESEGQWKRRYLGELEKYAHIEKAKPDERVIAPPPPPPPAKVDWSNWNGGSDGSDDEED